MAFLPKSFPRVSQPRSFTRTAGSLARGLVFAGVPSIDGRTLVDLSGNGFHGAPSGSPGRAAGRPGIGSTHLKASSQFFSLGNSSLLCPTSELTILVWWKQNADVDSSLFSRDDNTLGRAYTFDYLASTDKPRFYVNGGAGSVDEGLISDGTTMAVGETRLCIATFHDNLNRATIWSNGRIGYRNTAVAFVGTVTASTGATTVGSRTYSGFQDYASADIYLTALWNRELTDTECRQVSANPWQLFESGSPVPLFGVSSAVTFQPSWAAAANTVIQSGARAA